MARCILPAARHDHFQGLIFRRRSLQAPGQPSWMQVEVRGGIDLDTSARHDHRRMFAFGHRSLQAPGQPSRVQVELRSRIDLDTSARHDHRRMLTQSSRLRFRPILGLCGRDRQRQGQCRQTNYALRIHLQLLYNMTSRLSSDSKKSSTEMPVLRELLLSRSSVQNRPP